MSISDQIIKQQSFGKWVNVDLYKEVIRKKCKGKLGSAEISTLSNMFAIIFALKARDYVEYKIDRSPGDIKLDADKCAENLYTYLQNFPSIKNDWLELFVIGYSGEAVMPQNQNKNHSLKLDPSNDLQDDEYAVKAAVFVSALDDKLSDSQQDEIAKAIIKRTTIRKEKVVNRLAVDAKKQRVKKALKKIVSRNRAVKSSKKPRVIMIEYIFQGILSASSMIIGIKLYPALGMLSALSGGALGYLGSKPLFRGALKINQKLSHNSVLFKENIFGKKLVPDETKDVKSSHDEVVISDEVINLRRSITETVRRQKVTISKYSESKADTLDSITAFRNKKSIDVLLDDSILGDSLTVHQVESIFSTESLYTSSMLSKSGGISSDNYNTNLSQIKPDRNLPNVAKRSEKAKI